MKTQDFIRRASLSLVITSLLLPLLLTQGCAAKIPWHYYLQRTPIRVVIMPSGNKTEQPDAPVIFNKACEEALAKKGFQVISADHVVAYAASRGMLLNAVAGLKASELGKDLKADMVLFSDIDTWKSTYVVLNTKVQVSGTSRLVETSTDALVWRYIWNFQQDSSSGNNDLVGMLVSAAVSAVANSAFDACNALGTQAATQTVNTMPQPSIAPADSRPPNVPVSR